MQKGVSKSVKVFVGMTKVNVGFQEMSSKYSNDKKVTYGVEQIFLHPKLQTAKVGKGTIQSKEKYSIFYISVKSV